MGDHPDDAANFSFSSGGGVSPRPDKITSVVVTDEDNDPAGVLEKWDGAEWIYADVDALVPAER